MKPCANPACSLQQPDGYLMCKSCWKSIPFAVRKAFNTAGRAVGPRSTWKKQMRENPDAWNALCDKVEAAKRACFDALKNAPDTQLEEIQRMMP